MTAYARPRFNLLTGFEANESGWGLNAGGYNDLTRLLDAIAGGLHLVTFTPSTTPPGSPADGDAHVVAASAVDAWYTHDGEVAVWDEDAAEWWFFVPPSGLLAHSQDTGEVRILASGAFITPENLRQVFTFNVKVPGALPTSTVIAEFMVPGEYTDTFEIDVRSQMRPGTRPGSDITLSLVELDIADSTADLGSCELTASVWPNMIVPHVSNRAHGNALIQVVTPSDTVSAADLCIVIMLKQIEA